MRVWRLLVPGQLATYLTRDQRLHRPRRFARQQHFSLSRRTMARAVQLTEGHRRRRLGRHTQMLKPTWTTQAHDPGVLADASTPDEPVLLEELDRSAEEEAASTSRPVVTSGMASTRPPPRRAMWSSAPSRPTRAMP